MGKARETRSGVERRTCPTGEAAGQMSSLAGEQARNGEVNGSVQAASGTTDVEVEVEDTDDSSVAPVRYEITSYGVDFDVEGLSRRLQRDEIIIPGFQRNFVWNLRDASRFIESLLLGLPVPGIFLSRDPESGKYVVIDGQQRLKSIQFFYEGLFNPSPESRTQRAFKLTKVQEQFEGLRYEDLTPKDQLDLNNSVIHATVVKQDSPEKDDTSIYHIFDRINSGGRRLTQQEIRSAIYHGKLINELNTINNQPNWRSIFGKVHSRQRDQELILRFLAFFFDEGQYKPPLTEFLTKFVGRNRNPDDDFLRRSAAIFGNTMDVFGRAIDHGIFRPERALNAAVFDSMSVGLARRINAASSFPEVEATGVAYRELLEDAEYIQAVSQSTADEQSVRTRMRKAIERFAAI